LNNNEFQTNVLIRVPRLEVLSTYEYVGYFGSSYGDMNLTFINLEFKLEAQLGADSDARLRVDNLDVGTM